MSQKILTLLAVGGIAVAAVVAMRAQAAARSSSDRQALNNASATGYGNAYLESGEFTLPGGAAAWFEWKKWSVLS